MKRPIWSVCTVLLLCVAVVSLRAQTQSVSKLEWIDAHVHLLGGSGRVQDYPAAAKAALAVMDEAGITKMVLMPPPQPPGNPPPYDYESFVASVRQNPKPFAFLGGGGSLNAMIHEAGKQTNISDKVRRDFEAKANEILQQGAAGFGEIASEHLSVTHGHAYESTPADHLLFLLLADIAAQRDVVIDFHHELLLEDMRTPAWLASASPLNPPVLHANLDAFERLLEHNPKAKIVWAHVGAYPLGLTSAELCRKLLTKHPNLYIGLKPVPNRFAPQSSLVTPFKQIKSDWLQLLRDFPERFVMSGDQFFASPLVQQAPAPGAQFAQGAPIIRNRMRAFLDVLPPDLARKIASENAMQLYKLRD